MSKSYNTTWKDLKGKTKKELEEMEDDPDSELNQMVDKRMAKRKAKKERKTIKEENKNEL